ncbi:MAG: deoxyribose-phosphate aldolase [Selenomonadales bacterium]|jgi:deoxyribose-phosphate aldolase|nr:deoxyribose-phosphate aldolase [Selenomonadales bacterium]MBQ5745631.1 deoxyribose-phosphate aldolase [Selenomonadales bacterium]MBQ5859951.1 deoxyribose-phosphate aldolase [Selenomonadales bacterium]
MRNLSTYIDHTILKPTTSVTDIVRLCEEAAEHKFAAVCVPPCYVGLAANQLAGTGVNVATVIGFPLGSATTAVKVAETKDAVENKADEIDMVINVGAIKSGMWDAVTADIRAVVEASDEAKVKVIIETSQLTDEEKVRATECVIEAGADFVKTSTGFIGGGATVEDVMLLRRTIEQKGSSCRIKASGGIRTKADALAMIEAGADRIGTSAGVAIVTG